MSNNQETNERTKTHPEDTKKQDIMSKSDIPSTCYGCFGAANNDCRFCTKA